MGCGTSSNNIVHCVSSPVLVNKKKCLVGKFVRVHLPKEIWMSRMTTFIENHIKQLKGYSYQDVQIMYEKLTQYQKGIIVIADNTNKHHLAIKAIGTLFKNGQSSTMLREKLTILANEYCEENKEHEFEEIMFIFSIIVNAPMIKFFETKY
jgi:hypothetical protein